MAVSHYTHNAYRPDADISGLDNIPGVTEIM